jgi:photosystem II stability/assembly factor-like uncharacterized protein
VALACLIAGLAVAAPPAPTDAEVARKLGVGVEVVRQLRARHGLDNAELLALAASDLPRLPPPPGDVGGPDDPEARGRFHRLQEETAGKPPPPDARRKALQQLEDMRRQLPRRFRAAGLPAGPQVDPRRLAFRAAGLRPDRWNSLGPTTLGGRTRALLVDPEHPDVLLAGSAAGGVWRSADGGKSWAPTDDRMANLAISCLARDPSAPRVVYAGTGEGLNIGGDAVRGGGIFQSDDGGITWRLLPATRDFAYITRLAISADGRTLLTAVIGFKDRHFVAEETGIYRSDDPQHEKWVPCLRGLFGDVKFHPTDKNQAIAGWGRQVRTQNGPLGGEAYYSTDGGVGWKKAGVRPVVSGWQGGRVELTYALKDPTVVYASVQVPRTEQKPMASELWCSTDGGRTYERRPAREGGPQGAPAYWLGHLQAGFDQGDYANAVWAADRDLVLVGGLDLWRSTDGGKTLKRISDWTRWAWGELWRDTSPHADQHVIVAHPGFVKGQNKTVYVGNDGGIYRADDASKAGDKGPTAGWVSMNIGYQTLQFYAGACNARARAILAGAQDNGTHLAQLTQSSFGDPSSPPGRRPMVSVTWQVAGSGDGGFCALDPGADLKCLYYEAFNLRLFRHLKKGQGGSQGRYVLDLLANPDNKPPYLLEDARQGQTLFIAPFILDPNEPRRLLAGAIRLWRTNDARAEFDPKHPYESGPKWEPIKDPLPEAQGQKYQDPYCISAIAVAPQKSDVVWVGHANGQVFRTVNGTATRPQWARVGQRELPADRYCSRIALDATDPARAYVTFGGWNKDNVWKTEDGGQSWVSVPIQVKAAGAEAPPAPLEAPVFSLTVHPHNPRWLYIGTEVGVFGSDDGGKSWSPTNEGPANCRVDDLVWMDDWLVAVTHARGLFMIDLTLARP